MSRLSGNVSGRFAAAVLSAAAIFALTACGGASGNTSGTVPASTTTASAQIQTSDGKIKVENDAKATDEISSESEVLDSISIGVNGLWESLTPFRSNNHNKELYSYALYETLARQTAEGDYIPWVAKEWKMEEDKKTYTVVLNDNVTDTAGNKITVDDVVWFVNESKERGLKPIFRNIETCEKTGENEFKIVMKQDMVDTFESILVNVFVFSKDEFEKSGDEFATCPVTTSHYVVKAFTPQASLELERADNYWQGDDCKPVFKANIKNITFKDIKEASQAGIALETGEVDAFMKLDPNTTTQFEGNDKFTIFNGLDANGIQLYFSGIDSKLIQQDAHLRRAIAYAINTDAIIQSAYAGKAAHMFDVNPEVNIGYPMKWKQEEYYPYSVEKAKEELAQSAYKGEELVFSVSSNNTFQRIAQIIQGNLLEAGINVKLNVLDQAIFTSQRLDGNNYDLIMLPNGADSLANYWKTRYDSTSYELGDATSRKDETLTEMIQKTWTHDGFTEDNIDEIHNYIKDNMYGYGLAHPMIFTVYSSDLGIKDISQTAWGEIDFMSSTY